MGGGLLQLVAIGAQDAYLIGNPQITFWKSLYKRHTNFAMEAFRLSLTGVPNWGNKQYAIIERKADLAYTTYLEVVLKDGGYYNNSMGRLGYNLLKYIELKIGDNTIDKQYSEWLFIWDSLSSDIQTGKKLSQLVGLSTANGVLDLSGSTATCVAGLSGGRSNSPTVLYIPLNFFYCRSPGAALPLIALQYHEVMINIQWNDKEMVAGNFTNLSTVYAPQAVALYIDYIFLDVEERRRYAQQEHEYLIELVQTDGQKGLTATNNSMDLTLNHPVKELIWVVQPTSYTDCSIMRGFNAPNTRLRPFEYNISAVLKQRLQLNGQDRIVERYGSYFNQVQPLQHHTGSTDTIIYTGSSIGHTRQPGIYMYSFALKPEENQPSGTCNFSRIDNARLVTELSADALIGVDGSAEYSWNIRVYAWYYNILKISNGMGALAYQS